MSSIFPQKYKPVRSRAETLEDKNETGRGILYSPDTDDLTSPTARFSAYDHGSPEITVSHESGLAAGKRPPQSQFLIQDPQSQRSRSCLERLSDWWWWELFSLLFGHLCLVGNVLVLYYMNGKALRRWWFPIKPNAVLSILGTAGGMSLLYVVAECVSQIKWLRFERRPHPLSELQLIESSKGPIGALSVILKHKTFGLIAVVGAILFIVSVAVDPVTQQLLDLGIRSAVNPDATTPAFLNATQVYNVTNLENWTSDEGIYMVVDSSRIPTFPFADSFYPALLGGLSSERPSLALSCPTGNCTYPNFTSLGVCTTCEDVTAAALSSKTCFRYKGYRGWTGCTYMTPERLQLTAQRYVKNNTVYGTLLNATNSLNYWIDQDRDTLKVAQMRLSRTDNKTDPIKMDYVAECTIGWCARAFNNTNVTNGRFSTNVSEYMLVRKSQYKVRHGLYPEIYQVWEVEDESQNIYNGTGIYPGANRTFTLNYMSMRVFNLSFAGLFNNSLEMLPAVDWQWRQGLGVSSVLYSASTVQDLENAIRSAVWSVSIDISRSPNNTRIEGNVMHNEIYIKVTWPWLALPTCFAGLTTVLLVKMMLRSKRQGSRLWRSSVLPLLLVGIEGWDKGDLSGERVSEMEETAEGMVVMLRRDEDGRLKFVKC